MSKQHTLYYNILNIVDGGNEEIIGSGLERGGDPLIKLECEDDEPELRPE